MQGVTRGVLHGVQVKGMDSQLNIVIKRLSFDTLKRMIETMERADKTTPMEGSVAPQPGEVEVITANPVFAQPEPEQSEPGAAVSSGKPGKHTATADDLTGIAPMEPAGPPPPACSITTI